MIREFCEEDINYLNQLLEADIFQNPYLYIDTHTFGYREENYINTWVLETADGIAAIIYRYYNSIQFFQMHKLEDGEYRDIASFLENGKYEMITGSRKAILCLHHYLVNTYKASPGVIMSGEKCTPRVSGRTITAGSHQCEDIARLICSDKDIGGHYSVALLRDQIINRINNWNCRNIVVLENGKIVSHMATYADIDNLAILGGLVTDPSYRGKGYGALVLNDLCAMLLEERKKPVLYCYNFNTVQWYEKLGWRICTECGKLERKR